MKMIVAVVLDEYVGALTEWLTRRGFRATKLASTGGFLRAGNTTFLIGVEESQVDEVLGIIKAACPARRSIQGDLTLAEGALRSAAARPAERLPSEVEVSGAIVFVLDVESMHKI